jgi:hypothetical protein
MCGLFGSVETKRRKLRLLAAGAARSRVNSMVGATQYSFKLKDRAEALSYHQKFWRSSTALTSSTGSTAAVVARDLDWSEDRGPRGCCLAGLMANLRGCSTRVASSQRVLTIPPLPTCELVHAF